MNIVLDQDYIRVVDGAVRPELCQEIIELFEADRARHHHDGDRYIELDIFANRTGKNKWTPHEHRLQQWQPMCDELVGVVNTLVDSYRTHWDGLGMMPDAYAMEGMRVKAYRPDTHMFKLHVDQGNRASASRFLSFLLYLNDSDAGTAFVRPDVRVEARQGRVMMFPPMWMYPHVGEMPHSDSKYILSTYLHYKD